MEFNSNTELLTLFFQTLVGNTINRCALGCMWKDHAISLGLVAKDVQNTQEISLLDILMKI